MTILLKLIWPCVVRPYKNNQMHILRVCLSQDSNMVVFKSTNAISSFLPLVVKKVSAHGEVYSIKSIVIHFVSNLWREGDFNPVSSSNKYDRQEKICSYI